MSQIFHATTVLCVRRGNQVAMASDGQVTLGNTVVKSQAKKVRRMAEGRVLGGFAGSAADGIALFERLAATGSQTWMTGTEPALFEGIDAASRLHVAEGRVSLS